MQTRHRNTFITIKTEGAILPPDLLQRISGTDENLDGLLPVDYHLLKNEKLNEAINRSWNRLIGAWESFQTAQEKIAESQPGTTATRERWLLPLFQELDYGRLQTSTAFSINGKTYPISHVWGKAPVHLLGINVELDKRTARVAGAARTSPHSMVQEFLNRSDDHLWAFLSNGLQLRILRDNVSLTRQAYVEFDLQSMMDGEVYADFVLLWLLCHQSRVEGEKPEEFWLEKWSREAHEQGTRALDQLRSGVEDSISHLGSGFLTHPTNQVLRDNLRTGSLSTQDYYRQLLRMVYRLIFLFVAEDRDLLFLPNSDQLARQRYTDYYSTQRLRRLAERSRGLRHSDLYHTLRLVAEKLGSLHGCAELALPALGSFLFSESSTPKLDQAELPNRHLLDAVRSLAYTVDKRTLRPVDYKNLGPEELGSVYESLLELHPELNVDAGTFSLTSASGHERKTTGSYYTPASLIRVLLDSALDPVIEDRLNAVKNESLEAQEANLLDIKVCDPASGSGHFLIAAAHRLAKRLAALRTGTDEPPPEATRTALRDVIGHCIYGVDINPMAVELCKVSLWMEALEPGKPLSFLDAHIKCGNSLIGVGPGMEIEEIPDDAFRPAFGDDKPTATALRRRNKREREGQLGFRWDVTLIKDHEGLTRWIEAQAIQLEAMPEEEIRQVHAKAEAYNASLESEEYIQGRLEYDMWTASFFWPIPICDAENMLAPTQQELLRLRKGDDLDAEMVRCVREIAEKQLFFHWGFEFPFVFEEDNLGFDVVLGNPPYDVIRENRWLKYNPAAGSGNLASHFTLRAIYLIAKNGALGFVVPLSISCGKKHEVVRRTLYRNFQELWTSHYGIRPSKLFPGVDQRITLIRAIKKGFPPCRIFSTRLHRWNKGEVTKVLEGAEYGYIGELSSGLIPKVAGDIGVSIYKKILAQPEKVNSWISNDAQSEFKIYFHGIATYWIKAYNFLPFFQREGEEPSMSTTLREYDVNNPIRAKLLICLLNSSIFYYWWMTQSDDFHVTDKEVTEFPIPSDNIHWPPEDKISILAFNLMLSFKSNAKRRQRRSGVHIFKYDEFYPRKSLNEIHSIDNILGKIYGFTKAEIEFLKTYYLRYRTDEE